MTLHYVDDRHWAGWCDSKAGMGTTDIPAVTCPDCIRMVTAAQETDR